MPSLNIDLNYFDHPKTKRLIGLLGKGADVLPIRLWAYCGRVHPETGRLTGYLPQEIETLIGWWGEPGKCVRALCEVSYLKRVRNGFQVHDWLEHEGHIAAFSLRAKSAAIARWDKIKPKKKKHATSMRQALLDGCLKQCPKPNLTNPTHTALPGSEPPADKPPVPRPRRVLFDAVVEVFGLHPEVHGSRIGKVERDLKALNTTPDEFRARSERYRARFAVDGFEFTPEGVVKHWPNLESDNQHKPKDALDLLLEGA